MKLNGDESEGLNSVFLKKKGLMDLKYVLKCFWEFICLET